MKNKKINIKARLIAGVCIIILAIVAWILTLRLEGEKPCIKIESILSSTSAYRQINVKVSDNKSGLRKIWAGLIKDGKDVVLFEKDFPAKSFIAGGEINDEILNIKIDPKKIGIKDGKALFRITASDYSWRKWFQGNRTYMEKEIVIDTSPPVIDILSRTHNITQGGAGLVVYSISEPCPVSGINIGGKLFPGHSGYFSDDSIHIAFIALEYGKGSGTKMYATATDLAGNSSKAGFPYYIKAKKFQQDTINISDRFLNWKLPEFESDIKPGANNSMLEKFLAVNRKLRNMNFKSIQEMVKKSDNQMYWKGQFSRLPRSATRAGFADHRSYKYNGHVIDQQVHMGIDLASVAHSPVPAANRGKVAFAGCLGIYGKTLLIDHGFGLFSMYSHLSRIEVEKGRMVSKGTIMGRTGRTGLAGGDHLHFSILVNSTFVNPIEWWDAAWIKNNISSKLNSVQTEKNLGSF